MLGATPHRRDTSRFSSDKRCRPSPTPSSGYRSQIGLDPGIGKYLAPRKFSKIFVFWRIPSLASTVFLKLHGRFSFRAAKVPVSCPIGAAATIANGGGIDREKG